MLGLAGLLGCSAELAETAQADASADAAIDASDGVGGVSDTARDEPDGAADADALVDTDAVADADGATDADGNAAADADADSCNPSTCPQPAQQCLVATCTADSECAVDLATDASPCDDGAPCTLGESCSSGTCAGGVNVCACLNDADCVAMDDFNACNGTLKCDKSGLPYVCAIAPGSVIECSSAKDTACQKNACAAQIGKCALINQPNKATCDDGEKCTIGDSCLFGVCKPGVMVCACLKDADCATMEDGNLCNGTLVCDEAAGNCAVEPASVVTCTVDKDTTCSKNLCAPKTGKCGPVAAATGGPCDDGDVCTIHEVCKGGKCASDIDICQCKADADCASYDDGDACDPIKGCVYTPLSGGACDDGNKCTVDDTCHKGVCLAGKKVCP